MSIQNEIHARIQQFASELEVLVREAAIQAVRTSLGSSSSPTRSVVKTTPVRAAAPAPLAAPTSKSTLAFKRKKGTKRTAEQLAQIDAAIVSFVRTNAGKGVEHMAKALAVPSHDLKPRVAVLVDGKKLKKTGVKRATKYFAA